MTLITLIGLKVYGQDSMLCNGHHWTENEANIMMKKFSSEWDDLQSWEERTKRIKQGIIEEMQLDKMPNILAILMKL